MLPEIVCRCYVEKTICALLVLCMWGVFVLCCGWLLGIVDKLDHVFVEFSVWIDIVLDDGNI